MDAGAFHSSNLILLFPKGSFCFLFLPVFLFTLTQDMNDDLLLVKRTVYLMLLPCMTLPAIEKAILSQIVIMK